MKKRNKKGYYTKNRNYGYSHVTVRQLMKVWRYLNDNKIWLTKTDIAKDTGKSNAKSTGFILACFVKLGLVKKTRGTGAMYFRGSVWYYQLKDFNGLSRAGGEEDSRGATPTYTLTSVKPREESDRRVSKKRLNGDKPRLYEVVEGIKLPTSMGKRVTLYAMEHPKMSREELADHFKYDEHSIHNLLKISGILRNISNP